MRNPIRCVSAWFVIALIAAMMPIGTSAVAGPEHRSVIRIAASGQYPITKQITVGVDKSVVVELPRDVRDVHVSSPKNLDAVIQSGNRVYLIGVAVGQANAFFFDQEGRQIVTLEVAIERDLSAVVEMLERLMPGSSIKLDAVNDNVVISGRVRNAADATRASDVVGKFLGGESDKSKVVNMLAVDAREQVLLKVTVAEMQRDIMRRLGISWDGTFSIGTGVLGFGSNPGFALNSVLPALGNIINPDSATNPNFATTVGRNGVAGVFQTSRGVAIANLKALEQNGLMRTLAEPNLTAISGETANFLAGGEFPIPVAESDGNITIEFKPFGISLAFTPLVMSEGRISMKVSTEVSELSNDGAVTLTSINIPALKVRRANTTVELPSGGALVMAGLISDETKQALQGVPGLKNLPILGTLFRSRDFVKRETELVVIVTPYVVDPVARSELARPDDGFSVPSEVSATLLGHLNRVYGRRPKQPPVGRYKGDFGFIVE